MTVTIHAVSENGLTQVDIEPWHTVPVAIAVDLVPGEQVDHRIRPINSPGQQPKLFGRAVTACCEPPDFGAVLHALDQINDGDVLVIAADGRDDAAMIGEILGGHLRRCGGAGLVCDGAVRDVAKLRLVGTRSGSMDRHSWHGRALSGPREADAGRSHRNRKFSRPRRF